MRSEADQQRKIITQESLRQLMELRAYKNQIEGECKAMRRVILGLHAAGAPAELGSLVHEVRSRDRSSFTLTELTRNLSKSALDTLLQEVKHSSSLVLEIRKARNFFPTPWDHDD